MKKRNFGFTLIELLVVIVIIGILATISTATFKSYFGKARDAERQSAVQNIALMMKVDGADDWRSTKYIYETAAPLRLLMESNDFRVPKAKNNICYYIGMSDRSGSGMSGDQNEFVVATWGETTSTAETGTPGLLIDGTQQAIDLYEAAGLVKENFSCASAMTSVVDVMDFFIPGPNPLLYINTDGVIKGNLP